MGNNIAEDPTFNNVLSYIVDIFLVLSMFGCLATIITFLVFKNLRTQPIKLVVYLCMCIFWAQLFFFLTFYLYDTVMCVPCAMVFHYFFLADFIWTFSVAFNFYQMIVRRNRDAESLEFIYHLTAWIIPGIIVAAMAGTNNYYNRGGYCYMDAGIPIFLGFFVPGLFIVTANTVIFIFTVKEIHDTLRSAPNSDRKEKSKEMKVYFSIFASIGLSWLFGFAMVFITEPTIQLICLVLFSVLTPLQGFFIFISFMYRTSVTFGIYCCNQRIINRWGQLFGYQLLVESNVTSTTASGRLSSTNATSQSGRSNKDKFTNQSQHQSRNLTASPHTVSASDQSYSSQSLA